MIIIQTLVFFGTTGINTITIECWFDCHRRPHFGFYSRHSLRYGHVVIMIAIIVLTFTITPVFAITVTVTFTATVIRG